jgi:hypothetical protein
MKPFFPSIWNVLHDGGIDRIEGNVPGDVRVFVGIEYLRERFPDDGETIVVCLTNCTTFAYRPYESELRNTDLISIANESATILSAEMHGPVCRVYTDAGVLQMQCRCGSVSLDSGRVISLDELLRVAEDYWDEWESKTKHDR